MAIVLLIVFDWMIQVKIHMRQVTLLINLRYDALIFHYLDLEWWTHPKKLPDQSLRRMDQRYIMFYMESPLTYKLNFDKWNNYFNWTMTYRGDHLVRHNIALTFLPAVKLSGLREHFSLRPYVSTFHQFSHLAQLSVILHGYAIGDR